jgi:hypothetical protein
LCQKVFLPLTEAKWLGTGNLAHHRQQEANTPQNESRETMMFDEIEIDEMMREAQGDEVAQGALM